MPAPRIRLSKLATRGALAPRRLERRLAKRRQEVIAFEAWQRHAGDAAAGRQRAAVAKR